MQQFCTVQELSAIDPLVRATVVAGWAGRGNKVFRIAASFSNVPENSLDGAFLLANSDSNMADLEAALTTSAPAGVLVSGYRSASQSIIDAAEKRRIPVFFCSQPIEECGMEAALELAIQLVQRETITNCGENYFRRQLVNFGLDLPALLDNLADYLQNPVVLLDSSFQILAHGGGERFLSADELGKLARAARLKVMQRKSSGLMPETIYQQKLESANNQTINSHVAPLAFRGQFFGSILAFELTGQMNKLDLGQINETGISCLQTLVSRKNREETEKQYKEHFLYDLLYNNFESENALIKRARYWGWEFSRPHRLLIVEPDNFRQLLNKDQILEQLKISVAAFLQPRYQQAIISEMQDQVIIIIPGRDDDSKSNKQEMKKLAKLMVDEIQKIFPKITFSVGIGRFYSSVADLCRSYQEAKHSLALGRFIQESGHITHFEDLGVIRLLSHVSLEQLDDYYKEYLAALIEYDDKNGTNYLEILQEYFQQNCDLNLTAEKLFMHQNTLRYRLKKIEELLDADLQKLENRVSLSVACKIEKMRKTNR